VFDGGSQEGGGERIGGNDQNGVMAHVVESLITACGWVGVEPD
jgi:hypothetical protein